MDLEKFILEGIKYFLMTILKEVVFPTLQFIVEYVIMPIAFAVILVMLLREIKDLFK